MRLSASSSFLRRPPAVGRCFSEPTRAELALLAAWVLAIGLAIYLPAVALSAGYHQFADQCPWLGLPHAMDVLSNLAFVGMGLWVMAWQQRLPTGAGRPRRALVLLLGVGLLVTAVCSGLYHVNPHHAGLCLDRVGMSLTFAALLGLAVADRVSVRAGVATAGWLAIAAPAAAAIDYLSANMTPWTVLQGGGLVLLLALATQRTRPQALGFSLVAVVLIYALAKALELCDLPIFLRTGEVVSGHSLKHIVSAFAVWPVIHALQRRARVSAKVDSADTAQCTPSGTSQRAL